jgi:hypothetical protein
VSKEDKRKALLKARLEIARSEATAYIDDLAARLKEADGPNIPAGAIRNSLTRGQSDVDATLRLLGDVN